MDGEEDNVHQPEPEPTDPAQQPQGVAITSPGEEASIAAPLSEISAEERRETLAQEPTSSALPVDSPPAANISPTIQLQISAAEALARAENSRDSSPTSQRRLHLAASPSNVPPSPVQPVQSVYYAASQPIIYAIDASGAAIPFTASPSSTPPAAQYVQIVPSLSPSRPGSPAPFVQTVNGQHMLVRPLSPHGQQALQYAFPTTSGALQPVIPAALPSSSTTSAGVSGAPPPLLPESGDSPPPLPPKPPTHIASLSDTNTQTPGGDNTLPTVVTPVSPKPSSLPTPQTTRFQEPRRGLSWDESTFNSPSAARARGQPVAGPSSMGAGINFEGPPLTGIEASSYPPFTPTRDDRSRRNGEGSGNGRGGYSPAYPTSHASGSGSGSGRPRFQRSNSQLRQGYPSGRTASTSDGNRQSDTRGEDPNFDVERGEQPMYPPSRRNTRRSSFYDARLRGQAHQEGTTMYVDDSQIPFYSSYSHTQGVSTDSGGDDGGGGGLWRLLSWFGRNRRQRRKEASEVAEELSALSRDKTVAERLAPTLVHAREALRKARLEANITGWSLNIAIGAQVILGALTTGVAAATTGRQTSIAITVLGVLATLAASYLAKARGSGEPEASALRCRELENFVRDLQNLGIDRGAKLGGEHDELVQTFRDRYEKIMGNNKGGTLMGEFVREKVAEEHRHQLAEAQQAYHGQQDVFDEQRNRRTGAASSSAVDTVVGEGDDQQEEERERESEREREKARQDKGKQPQRRG